MMRRAFLIFSLLLASIVAFPSVPAQSEEDLPLDPQVLYGELPCGTRYYIQRSLRPAYKANFYLLNNIGSTVEEDDERGFAHFTEHSAFNGSKNYPGKSMLTTLERHGLRFGYDVNAYTGFDATVYNISHADLSVSDEMIDTCLLMLKDIAVNLTLDDASINAERKIIIEEWRQGAKVLDRYLSRAMPLLFGKDNRYATRQPIGVPEVLQSFAPARLREFYKKWYQPQHQAIIVVGYVQPKEVEKAIKRIWRDVKAPKNPTERPWAQIPDHKGIRATAFVDAEFPGSQVDFWWKLPIPPRDSRNTAGYVADCYVGLFAEKVMKNRMVNVSHEPNAIWSTASAEYDQYYSADSKDSFRLYALYDANHREEAIERVVVEAKKAALFGITKTEFDVTKEELTKLVDKVVEKTDALNNEGHFDRISEHFLKGNPLLAPELEAQMMKNFLDTVSESTINRFLSRTLRPDNLSVLIAQKSGFDADSLSRSLAAHVDSLWRNVEVQPHADSDSLYSRPIMARLPEDGKIVKETSLKPFDAKFYELSNGATVIACRSSVVNDEIELRAVRRTNIKNLLQWCMTEAKLSGIIADVGGIGDFSANDLRRRLQSTKIDVTTEFSPYVDEIRAVCASDEIETMLQLVHQRMLDVRADTVAFANWQKAVAAMLNDEAHTPEGVFADSLHVLLFGNAHPIERHITPAEVEGLNYDVALSLARARLADPAHYTFIITGDFQPDDIAPLLVRYIGSLPEAPVDNKSLFMRGMGRALPGCRSKEFTIDGEVAEDVVSMVYELHRPYSLDDEMALKTLAAILDARLLQSLRAEAGATYGANVTFNAEEVDDALSLAIHFECSPGKAQEMIERVRKELNDIATGGPTEGEFAAIHDYLVEEASTAMLQQRYPMEYFTHLVVYKNRNRADRLPTLTRVTPTALRTLATALLNISTPSTSSTPSTPSTSSTSSTSMGTVTTQIMHVHPTKN